MNIIPLVDLKRQYKIIEKDIQHAISDVIKNSAFILGEYTQEFEKQFAQYCGVRHCIGVGSGTDALLLAYMALGIGKDDEVITSPLTFFATTEPLSLLGGRPIFVDIDPDSYLIDVKKIEKKITPRTKAIVVVHLYGQMVEMDPILDIARRYHLKIIEDCAQAHGAEYKGKKAGTMGDIGIYSFYPGKNLGAYGDAGCIVTQDTHLDTICRKLRDHGRTSKYAHEIVGLNARMDGIQAAILSVKLNFLDEWNDKRRLIAEEYNDLLKKNVKIPQEQPERKHVYHLYVIKTDERDALLKFLKKHRIEAGIHYPIPLHQQKVYSSLASTSNNLPIAEEMSKKILSLPIFPELSQEEIKYVGQQIISFFHELY